MTLSVFDPWIWVAVAAVLSTIEILAPGFLLLGFGIGAGIVAIGLFLFGALLRALPYAPLMVFVIWAAFSVAAWLMLTRIFGRPSRRKRAERDINDFDNSA